MAGSNGGNTPSCETCRRSPLRLFGDDVPPECQPGPPGGTLLHRALMAAGCMTFFTTYSPICTSRWNVGSTDIIEDKAERDRSAPVDEYRSRLVPMPIIRAARAAPMLFAEHCRLEFSPLHENCIVGKLFVASPASLGLDHAALRRVRAARARMAGRSAASRRRNVNASRRDVLRIASMVAAACGVGSWSGRRLGCTREGALHCDGHHKIALFVRTDLVGRRHRDVRRERGAGASWS